MSTATTGLIAPLLDEAALASMRHRLRDLLGEAGVTVKMGHAAEALACGFGAATHAALLARLAKAGGAVLNAPFDEPAVTSRIEDLTGGKGRGPAVREFVGLALLTGRLAAAGLEAARSGDEADRLPPIDWKCTGRMISASKGGYLRRFPDNLIAFNAQVCTRSGGRVWCGDLDVTRDAAQLEALAIRLGEEVFVLRESITLPADGALPVDRAIARFGASAA